jgi:hypothetical protein
MYRVTRATRDLVVCVNGKECSVEELESTKEISEMEGCIGSALSCDSVTFCVKLQIVTLQRYR